MAKPQLTDDDIHALKQMARAWRAGDIQAPEHTTMTRELTPFEQRVRAAVLRHQSVTVAQLEAELGSSVAVIVRALKAVAATGAISMRLEPFAGYIRWRAEAPEVNPSAASPARAPSPASGDDRDVPSQHGWH